jgi:hypothetical protein
MSRTSIATVFVLLFASASVLAQDGIQRGKIKKVDAEKSVVTVTADGKDLELTTTDETRFMNASGQQVKDGLKSADFKAGEAVMFKYVEKDGKKLLIGLKAGGHALPNAGGPPPLVKVDSSKFKPLSEFGAEKYQGFEGGLYPGGKNERPAEHEAAGLALAKQVQPLDADGKPSPNGKIVLLSVGMSNTAQSSGGFARQLAGFADVNPQFQFINGAQGGMTAFKIQDPNEGQGATYWSRVDEMLKVAGATRAQVQAIWIKQADAGPSEGFPGYAKKLQAELAKIVQIFPSRFPNCKMVYLSSRTYGGYAKTPLNPEPYAYESGFSAKWLIEQQIKGEPSLNYDPKKGAVKAPWLSWGPYLWANGSTKRADGFSYSPEDFSPSDGTHQSNLGTEKVGKLMLDFFKSDNTTKPWFLKSDAK